MDDGDARDIFSKGFSFLGIRTMGLLVGYIFTYLVARHYGASVNGLVSLSFSLFLFVSIFGRLGIDINLVKFYSNELNWEAHKGLFFRVLLKAILISSVLALLLYLTRGFFVNILFKKPQFEPYILWTVLAIPCWVVTLVCAGYLRAREHNKWFAFLNTPGRFAFAIPALLLMYYLKDDPLNAIIAHFYGVLLLALLSFIVVLRDTGTLTFRTGYNSWAFMREAFPMMISGAIIVFLGWMDTFVLGIFASDETIGVYSVALKVASLTSFSLQAINSILMPKIARNHQENKLTENRNLVRFSTSVNFAITLGIVIVIIVFREWILGMFGAEFVAGTTILMILCLGQVINSLSGSVGVILQMTGNQKLYQNIVLLALVLNIVFNLILTPIFGATGTAVATVISISSWNILGAIYIKRKLDIDSFFNPFYYIK
jgi:O-antigen/teichoic acid export membrane protein